MYTYPNAYHPLYQNSMTAYQQFPRPSYPEVDSTLFNESAIAFQELMKDASKIINKIANSKHFASELMSAAQSSDQQKVNELIQSTGVKTKVDTSFNPDGLKLMLLTDVKGSDCCHLTMDLRWR